MLKSDKKFIERINKTINELKLYIHGTIPLEADDLKRRLAILAKSPSATMYFLQLVSGRLQTSKLTDADRNKLFQACTKESESAYWLVSTFPESEFREEAVKQILTSPKWSTHFRINRLYKNDIEMHRASKKGITGLTFMGDFLNNVSNLDMYEKNLIIKTVMENSDINLAGALKAGAYPKLDLNDEQKETLQSLLTAFKLAKGE